MRTAIYIRVSTDEQATEGYSISAQRDRLVAYCKSQEWTVSGAYIEEGQSAKDMDRPELRRLISDAENGMFDVVLVYKLDRLTRSVLDLYTLLQTFERYSIKFKSATELYDTTTAMGKLFITLVAALAQWERENLAERVRVGMEQMVTEGKRPGGPVPFGYNSEYRVVTEEKFILRELRRLYMEERLGFYTIAKTLNARDMKRRNNVEWSSFTVYSVLDNPFYAGKLRWGGRDSNGKYVSRKLESNVEYIIADSDHEPIFTWEEYKAHKERMKSREFGGHSRKTEYWFTGLLRCAKCGSAMTGRVKVNKRKDGSESRFINYICSNKQSKGTCKMPIIRQTLIEHLVIEHLKTRIETLEDYRSEVESLEEKGFVETSELARELDNLTKSLSKIKERKRKLQHLLLDDLITQDEYKERISEERYSEESINKRVAQIKNELTRTLPTATLAEDEIKGLLELWPLLDDADKNIVMRDRFDSIVVDSPLESSYGVGRRGKFLPASIRCLPKDN